MTEDLLSIPESPWATIASAPALPAQQGRRVRLSLAASMAAV